jgi:hypothetical protein
MTSKLLDAELELLRKRLGLERSKKADLLREMSGLAAWVVRQTEQGWEIEARRGGSVEPLIHPALERVRARRPPNLGESLALDASAIQRLAAILDRPFTPTPALRAALANLASGTRRRPRLRWKKKAAAA